MSYLEFFGFKDEPFSTAPDTRFYFDSQEHSQAMLRLRHAIERMRGLAVIVGDVGTGKTMLARRLLDALDENEYESALLVVVHSQISTDWFLKKIAMQFGIENVPEDKIQLLSSISQRLMEIYELGKKAVVLVDEAQMLRNKEIMEELRGLLNIELPERKLITFVLFGLPELDDVLQLDPPLAQRVAMRYELRPFDKNSTVNYIQHRLKLAGAENQEIFDTSVYDLIHSASKGIPRTINTICDNALFEAYLLKRKRVDYDIVKGVVSDLRLQWKQEEKTSQQRLAVNEVDIAEVEDIVERIEEIDE